MNGMPYTSFAQDGDRWYVDVPVCASEFGETFVADFNGNMDYTVNYSVNHYLAGKYDPEMQATSALIRAIYNYGVSAAAYAAQ